jgi:hypothetical protein
MKYFRRILSAAILCSLMVSSCSKNEQSTVEDIPIKLTKYQLSVPLTDGRASIELNAGVLESSKQSQKSSLNSPIQILNPDQNYINSTTLMSIKNLKIGTQYTTVQDQKLKLSFGVPMLKMDQYPNGWNALWNVPPFVECERPQVLYSMQENHLSIILSKYCTVFGFELAPNLYNSFEFIGGFYTSKENSPVATVTRMVASPSGAQLFAVNSSKPFNNIEIQFSGIGSKENPYGFAITNLRYKLCKP